MIDIDELTEDEARNQFQKLRWPETQGRPVCPWCGGNKAYSMRTLYEFKCRRPACFRRFSVTTNTAFANRKLPFRTLLKALDMASRGEHLNAWKFSRELFISYKTGYVLSRRIIEAFTRGGLSSPKSDIWVGYWQTGRHNAQ